jgi:hypothetical protein
MSYNASAVKINNGTSSLVRLKTKKFRQNWINAQAYYNAGVVAVNAEVVGLTPM